jgi:zinc protease
MAQTSSGPVKEASIANATHSTIVAGIPYEKYKLKNGLEVILSENHRLPVVAVNIWYHVGPANEKQGRTGFAHLFEHLMFEGSAHVGERAHFKYLEAAGATNINGTTEFDRTNYFETVPSNELEKALWLESDRMGFLLGSLNEATLASQRDVVRNERRQVVDNEPYGLADEALFHTLFPQDHPYHAHVIGSHADIEAAQLNDVREFFKLYYAPNNASLVIAGDINKVQVKQLVEKYFGPIPAGAPVPKISATPPHINSERRIVVTDKITLPRVYIGWITDPIFKPGDAAEHLLGRILGGGRSRASRLYQHLVHDKQIAQDIHAEQYSLALGSVFFIQVTARQGVRPEQIEAAIDEELADLQKNGPTQKELERERNVAEARLLRSVDKLGGLGGVADRLNFYNHYVGDPGFLQKDIDRYERVTTRDIQLTAQKKLSKNSRVVIYCVPGEKILDDVPRSTQHQNIQPPTPDARRKSFEQAQAWRDRPPAPGTPSRITLPSAKQFKLPNGLRVMIIEKHDLPLVTVNMTVLGGNGANPTKYPGLASFTASMLETGTKTRSDLQIAIDADQNGTEIESSSDNDRSTVSVSCLKQHLSSAFDLLADMILNPAFAPEEIERVRKKNVSALLQDNNNSPKTASRIFQELIYGKEHPYGYPQLGTEDALRNLQREDILEFWRKTYVPANAALVLAGDITETEAQKLAAQYFGQWKGDTKIDPPPGPAETAERRIAIVSKPGAAQSSILVGRVGIAHSSPDYVVLDVMNAMLGGLFSSRINMNLREKHGYAYAAFSQFTDRRSTGTFFVSAEVRTDVTAAAIGQIMEELRGIHINPLSADEIKIAKDHVSRSLPVLFATTVRSAQSFSDLFVYGLPIDYYAKLPSEIESVTAQQVAQAAAKYIRPEDMTIVVVGDRERIESSIKQLDLGPVQIRDRQGN